MLCIYNFYLHGHYTELVIMNLKLKFKCNKSDQRSFLTSIICQVIYFFINHRNTNLFPGFQNSAMLCIQEQYKTLLSVINEAVLASQKKHDEISQKYVQFLALHGIALYFQTWLS